MKIDFDARTLTVSVRELASPRQRTVVGMAGHWRARLGTRAHVAYGEQATAEATDEVDVTTEVSVTFARRVLDFDVTVRGRADVVRVAGERTTVEEVKSVLSRPGDDKLARAMFQARLYALALDDETTTVDAQVVLYSLVDGRTEVLDARYERGEVENELDETLGVLIEELLAQADFRSQRRAAADAIAFPFDAPRANQLELMEILEEALDAGRPGLAAAPTGIGKTVSTLVPALRYALRNDATVFYLTAKTTQRKLVGETFAAIERASGSEQGHRLHALTLRSRKEMCPPKHLRCHPALCPMLARFDERLEETRALDGLLEASHLAPDAIYREGQMRNLCPYELSMRAVEHVDVIIGDYNHVFDGRVTPAALGPVTSRVVVIDEAHNLFDRARAHFSPFVGRAMARRALETARTIEPPRLGNEIYRWCEAVSSAAIEGARYHGEGERPLADGCGPATLDLDEWQALAEEGELLGARYAQERYLRAMVQGDDPVLELVAAVSQLHDLAASGDEELVPFASTEAAERGVGVGVVCVDPSRRLEVIHRRALGTLAVSATMAPITYFSEVLGLHRMAPVLTSAPSPFPKELRRVLIATDVSTTYRERDEHAPAIADRIEQMYRARPGRYIAFFSSFAFAETVRKHLTLSPREVLVQLPAGGHAARKLILRQLKQRSATLLLAVMGGVFGEGIDLPGDDLIGVTIVGPGLPPVSFERLAMQHYFSERHDRGFAYAMVYPGLQRVIQAAGRVIRTMEDAGVIVLVGRRFGEMEYLDCLPEHWYRHRPEELITDDLSRDLDEFWGGLNT